ncbi:uncharacterized protein LOC127757935 [Oryza glaberrima]|uniref:uncharacterized protein LOC127757935 n=1 Tax=Oryza glaberrima TaxID=4538 RepID=UPI00224C4619|nr:uncharacterized protein LOC127757935 [Oryza glaberrima]
MYRASRQDNRRRRHAATMEEVVRVEDGDGVEFDEQEEEEDFHDLEQEFLRYCMMDTDDDDDDEEMAIATVSPPPRRTPARRASGTSATLEYSVTNLSTQQVMAMAPEHSGGRRGGARRAAAAQAGGKNNLRGVDERRCRLVGTYDDNAKTGHFSGDHRPPPTKRSKTSHSGGGGGGISIGNGGVAGDPDPAALELSMGAAQQEAMISSDGWESEPFMQELLFGSLAPLDVPAAAADLWSF